MSTWRWRPTTRARQRSTAPATRPWVRSATPRTSRRGRQFSAARRRAPLEVPRQRVLARRQHVLDQGGDLPQPLDRVALALLEHPHLGAQLLLAPADLALDLPDHLFGRLLHARRLLLGVRDDLATFLLRLAAEEGRKIGTDAEQQPGWEEHTV